MSKDYYKILGVERDASADDIKGAFRTLSKQHHPDLGGDAEKFKELNEAYQTLSDVDKKAAYDNPSPFGGMGGNYDPFEDMVSRHFNFNQRTRRTGPPVMRGKNIILEHNAPLRIFIFGGQLKLNLSFDDVCTKCMGTGAETTESCASCSGSGMKYEVRNMQGLQMRNAFPCPDCRGTGNLAKERCKVCEGMGRVKVNDREVMFTVHPGSRDGDILGAQGQGGQGLNGGPPGDVIVKLQMVLPNPSDLTKEQKKILESIQP